jgi:hypothetical protein
MTGISRFLDIVQAWCCGFERERSKAADGRADQVQSRSDRIFFI